MSEALIVFAKVPRPGDVKTRLTPVLTPEEAARLYRAFLQDALAQYQSLDVDVRLYLAGERESPADGTHEGAAGWGKTEALSFLNADAAERLSVYAQSGDGLGARMQTALRDTFDAGYDRACLIGTDHPTLPIGFVRQAFKSLAAARSICIGPSADGGFYLLGMGSFYPGLFRDMTYSHSRVFTATLARASHTDARLTVLPRWYDVDTPETLRRMLDDLKNGSTTAPHTQSVVDDLELTKIAT